VSRAFLLQAPTNVKPPTPPPFELCISFFLNSVLSISEPYIIHSRRAFVDRRPGDRTYNVDMYYYNKFDRVSPSIPIT
jgi:hypothetical protein